MWTNNRFASNEQAAQELFQNPREDVVYGVAKTLNEIISFSYPKNNPFAAVLTSITLFVCLLVLITAAACQVSVNISRDVTLRSVQDVALSSQIDN